MDIEAIAVVCHEVNRSLCDSFGDHSQCPWNQAEKWQRESAINGVLFRLQNPYGKESDQHDNWMAVKISEGWTYGPIKDATKKEHPCLVCYKDLPPVQRAKDALFMAVVDSLKQHLEKSI